METITAVDAVEMMYNALLEVIKALMDLDPAEDSPEGRLLSSFSAIAERYEQEKYPHLTAVSGDTPAQQD
jgi:hypothetical protein